MRNLWGVLRGNPDRTRDANGNSLIPVIDPIIPGPAEMSGGNGGWFSCRIDAG